MNYFSASIVLSQVTAQQYVDMTPEQRIELFGEFIGVEAIVSLFQLFSLSILTLFLSDYL
jgi:hypothetical protein